MPDVNTDRTADRHKVPICAGRPSPEAFVNLSRMARERGVSLYTLVSQLLDEMGAEKAAGEPPEWFVGE